MRILIISDIHANLTAFETFFPEKRPFFLENASFFETPINLFFSRRIVDPKVGGRVTGRAGAWAIGALYAEADVHPIALTADNEYLMDPRQIPAEVLAKDLGVRDGQEWWVGHYLFRRHNDAV